MSQAESGSILFKRVLLEVSPDIFCHPIWIHFIESGASPSSSLIRDLLDSARYYKDKNDIFASCQILLICACLLKRINQLQEALETIQEAWNLAKANGFRRILLWSSWGAASISIEQRDMLRATHYLDTMQDVVNQENDWVFKDVLELLKRALTREEEIGTLRVLLDWLNRWGESPCKSLSRFQEAEEIDRGSPVACRKDNHTRIPFRWWRTFLQRIREGTSLRRLWKLSSLPRKSICLHEGLDIIPKFSNLPNLAEQGSSVSATIFRPPERTSQSDSLRIAQTQKSIPSTRPPLAVYCLGSFRVIQDNSLITDWPSGKGKDILKYLMIKGGHNVLKDVLMDVFWPDAEPEAARNNLNVAIYGLRQAFRKSSPDFEYIRFQDDHYLLSPDVELWVDADEFLKYYESGQRLARQDKLGDAIKAFEKAISLYHGDLFESDLYEEWSIPPRENLKDIYLLMLDQVSRYHFDRQQYLVCIALCNKLLAKDNCRENAHRRLMICYSRQGHPSRAMQQYNQCLVTLKNELDMAPSTITKELYDKIRRGHPV